MKNEEIAIAISLLSFIVAAFALGWNVYRDVILKPRLKVGFNIMQIVGSVFPKEPMDTLILSVTNFGPGQIHCAMIHFKAISIWRRITKQKKLGAIIHDYEHPLNKVNLPYKLEVGERADFILPLDDRCILNHDITHIGMRDSFNKLHWAPKKQVKEAKKLYNTKYKQEK